MRVLSKCVHFNKHGLSPLQDHMVCHAGPAVSVPSSSCQANTGCHPEQSHVPGRICPWQPPGGALCRLRSVTGKLPFLHACHQTALSFHQLSGGEKCLRCHAWDVQIAAVAAWEADDSAADGDTSNAVACAAAAQHMLLQLMTETSHGIALPVMSAVSALVRDVLSGKTFGAGPGYPSFTFSPPFEMPMLQMLLTEEPCSHIQW